MKRLFVLALMCSCLVFLPPSAGIAHTPVPTVPAASAKLWIPLMYKNHIVPRIVWSRLLGEDPYHYAINLSFENGTQHCIQIDSYTVNFFDASGQVVGSRVKVPGNLLWVLDPGEKIALRTSRIPTTSEAVNVHVSVAWHPTDEQFITLDILETKVMKCSDLGTWHELYFRARNPTNRTIHRATILMYTEKPIPWDCSTCQGDLSQYWYGGQVLLSSADRRFPLEPGEEFRDPFTLCAGQGMWTDTDPTVLKVIARWSDTSPYPPPYPYPIPQVSGSATN